MVCSILYAESPSWHQSTGYVNLQYVDMWENALQAKPPSILYEEPNNQICSMDVEASVGRDIMCATDQECLVYLSRH